MRRQARISAGGALVVRTASALQVWLWLLIFVFQNEFRISRSIQPGYLDFDNLPETNFTCTGKVIGGYYADLETSCQMFHVCTVGQAEEPMDIKFLCLNGTVFDQETRVCERVDEVDCTKSEKFYSLNLELYGSTAPPIIQPDHTQPQKSTENYSTPKNEKTTSAKDEVSTISNDKAIGQQEVIDSTEDPIQEIKKEIEGYREHHEHSTSQAVQISENDEPIEDEEEEINSELTEYEDDYHAPTTTNVHTTTTTTTTTRRPPVTTTTTLPPKVLFHQPSPVPHIISSVSPSLPPLSSPTYSSSASSATALPTLDPALLSPQEFIYRHRGPGSEAISFQRQGSRPADGVYITHAPPQQYDHFPYESSRTAPRPAAPRPTAFAQRPAPFRATTLDPNNQLLRPGPTSLPSERHETIKNRPIFSPSQVQRPLSFDPVYYDRKRSDDLSSDSESSLSPRSVAPPHITEKPTPKPKSPPRIIVTASASVSDSNGKRLNYTVGNVVSAVKPIVPINYDDYKESDLIFDPFFLDVPKLQKRRKSRSIKGRHIVIAPYGESIEKIKETKVTHSTLVSHATTTSNILTSTTKPPTTTSSWNPNDYVDDNYEPQSYVPPPVPPVPSTQHYERKKPKKMGIMSVEKLVKDKEFRDSRRSRVEEMELSLGKKTPSSHIVGVAEGVIGVVGSLSPPPPADGACAPSRHSDCHLRA